jgi:hypothetical protein
MCTLSPGFGLMKFSPTPGTTGWVTVVGLDIHAVKGVWTGAGAGAGAGAGWND